MFFLCFSPPSYPPSSAKKNPRTFLFFSPFLSASASIRENFSQLPSLPDFFLKVINCRH